MHKKLSTFVAMSALMVLSACGSSAGTDGVRAISADITTVSPSTTTIQTSVKAEGPSTLTAPPTTTTTTTTTSARPTTTTTRRLAEPVEWVVGFHQWPGLQPGDTFFGETIIKTHERLRAILLKSDDPAFKRRAEQRRNVRYADRNKARTFNDLVWLPHHDYGPGDVVPAGPRWPFPNAGIEGSADIGCVWLLDENDKRYNVLWPEGFTMQYGEPLTIYNQSHDPVWKKGQRFDIETKPSRSAELWQRVPRKCRVSSRDKEQPDDPFVVIMSDQVPEA